MINLLPPYQKQEIFYGRLNTKLLKWLVAVMFLLIGITAIIAFGKYQIELNTKNLQTTAEATKNSISVKQQTATRNDIKELSNNFKVVTQLLSKQVLFSKIFVKLGTIMPPNSVLKGVTLSTTSSSIDFNIGAANRDIATQAFINISDPNNGLFDKADLLSLNCTSGAGTTPQTYPCVSNIRVVIKKESTFYFLSSITESKKLP